MLSHFTGLRILHKNPIFFSSLLRLSHGFPLKVLSAYVSLILFSRVLTVSLAGAGADGKTTGPQSEIACPDGYAIRLDQTDPHPGRYLRCEEYDRYQELVEGGQIEQAEGLTHGLGH